MAFLEAESRRLAPEIQWQKQAILEMATQRKREELERKNLESRQRFGVRARCVLKQLRPSLGLSDDFQVFMPLRGEFHKRIVRHAEATPGNGRATGELVYPAGTAGRETGGAPDLRRARDDLLGGVCGHPTLASGTGTL